MNITISDLLLVVCGLIVVIGFFVWAFAYMQGLLDGCLMILALMVPGVAYMPLSLFLPVGISALITMFLMVLSGLMMVGFLYMRHKYGHFDVDL